MPTSVSESASKLVSDKRVVDKVASIHTQEDAEKEKKQNVMLQDRINKLTDGSIPAFSHLLRLLLFCILTIKSRRY